MDAQTHWEQVYTTKAPETVSWYRPHLEASIAIIDRLAGRRSASIIDIGGGESTLVDDLLAHGYNNLTVLDVSATALEVTKKRLGVLAEKVHWLTGDIIQCDLKASVYDLWHDRAAFHFLTDPGQRRAYVEKASHAIPLGGHLILSTFGPEGPPRCSGLEVVRYSADSLQQEVGACFQMVENFLEWHTTPTGSAQQFLYCAFQRIDKAG
jgi:SAM-dependent methyltransferase